MSFWSRSYLVENRWNFQLEFHDRVRLLSILHTFWQSKHDIGKSIFIDDSPDKSRDFQLRGLFSLGWSGSWDLFAKHSVLRYGLAPKKNGGKHVLSDGISKPCFPNILTQNHDIRFPKLGPHIRHISLISLTKGMAFYIQPGLLDVQPKKLPVRFEVRTIDLSFCLFIVILPSGYLT